MKLRVLGCSGGIGGNLRTTSLLLDHDVLIDAGTGVGELSLTELAMIDHVFVTHSHLDHIACIPMMVDSAGSMRDRPLTVYASEETLTSSNDIFSIGKYGRISARFPMLGNLTCDTRLWSWAKLLS